MSDDEDMPMVLTRRPQEGRQPDHGGAVLHRQAVHAPDPMRGAELGVGLPDDVSALRRRDVLPAKKTAIKKAPWGRGKLGKT